MYASEVGEIETIRLLVDHDADVNSTDKVNMCVAFVCEENVIVEGE